jgi:hypothetical protein
LLAGVVGVGTLAALTTGAADAARATGAFDTRLAVVAIAGACPSVTAGASRPASATRTAVAAVGGVAVSAGAARTAGATGSADSAVATVT